MQGSQLESLINQRLELAIDENELNFRFSNDLLGKIVDFQGNVIENEESSDEKMKTLKEKNVPEKIYKIQEIFKRHDHIKKRTGTDGQIWTGFLLPII